MANLLELGFACDGLDSIGVEIDGILQVLVVWKKSPSYSEPKISGFQIWGSTTSRRSLMANREPSGS